TYQSASSPQLLQQALQAYQLANQTASLLRTGISQQQDKLSYTAETHQRAEQALEVAYPLYEAEPSEAHLELALD
ncbi:MAG: hypothetical protein AAF696_34610, partial [Bacteroidota bacterium]